MLNVNMIQIGLRDDVCGWRLRELTEVMSEEDLVGLCQGGYGEFWPVP